MIRDKSITRSYKLKFKIEQYVNINNTPLFSPIYPLSDTFKVKVTNWLTAYTDVTMDFQFLSTEIKCDYILQ